MHLLDLLGHSLRRFACDHGDFCQGIWDRECGTVLQERSVGILGIQSRLLGCKHDSSFHHDVEGNKVYAWV